MTRWQRLLWRLFFTGYAHPSNAEALLTRLRSPISVDPDPVSGIDLSSATFVSGPPSQELKWVDVYAGRSVIRPCARPNENPRTYTEADVYDWQRDGL